MQGEKSELEARWERERAEKNAALLEKVGGKASYPALPHCTAWLSRFRSLTVVLRLSRL